MSLPISQVNSFNLIYQSLLSADDKPRTIVKPLDIITVVKQQKEKKRKRKRINIIILKIFREYKKAWICNKTIPSAVIWKCKIIDYTNVYKYLTLVP